jgi:DNA-binding MarR family transcriptional regulator
MEKKCLLSIVNYKAKNEGQSPSLQEIADDIGCTEAYAGRLVKGLRDKGRLAPNEEGKRRFLKVLRAN